MLTNCIPHNNYFYKDDIWLLSTAHYLQQFEDIMELKMLTENTMFPVIMLENTYTATGFEELLNSRVKKIGNNQIVIFDSAHYRDSFQYINENSICIMLYSETPPMFLSKADNFEFIDVNSSLIKIKEKIESAIRNNKNPQRCRKIVLSNNERKYIDLMLKSYSPQQISRILDIKLKTVYSIRRSLTLKLSCKSTQDLIRLCLSTIFSSWYKNYYSTNSL